MNKVLITGASGQLGRSFLDLQPQFASLEVFGLSHQDFDIAEENDYQILSELGTDIVINCAAYTKVDEAEDNPAMSYKANATGPGRLAAYCFQNNVRFVHFSTDYVYHNDMRTPIPEESNTEPKGIYARSKLEGDRQIITSNSKALIFRFSWLFSPYGKNLIKTIVHLCQHQPEIRMVNDQFSSPTYSYDLARAVLKILTDSRITHDRPDIKSGVYNFTNEGPATPYEISMAIKEYLGSPCKVIPVSLSEYPSKVVRPVYSVLNLAKFKQNFDIPVPHWRYSLAKCLEILKTN